MGYKLSLRLLSESGNCDWYYLKGFRNGKPILVGRDCAKIYKKMGNIEKAFEKWLGYYEKNNIVVRSCLYVDTVE